MLIICGHKRFKQFTRKYKRLVRENKYLKEETGSYYHKLRNSYERKKLELLDIHRTSKDQVQCKKLTHEINALNEILKLGKVDEKNIHNTLIGHPSYK